LACSTSNRGAVKPAISRFQAGTRRPTASSPSKVGERNFLANRQTLSATATMAICRGIDLWPPSRILSETRVSAASKLRQTEYVETLSVLGREIDGTTLAVGTPLGPAALRDLFISTINHQASRRNRRHWPRHRRCRSKQAALGRAGLGLGRFGNTVTYSRSTHPKSYDQRDQFATQAGPRSLGVDVKFLPHHRGPCAIITRSTMDVVSLVRDARRLRNRRGGNRCRCSKKLLRRADDGAGVEPNGIGPRDITPGTNMANVGGSTYWATTRSCQRNIPGRSHRNTASRRRPCRCGQPLWLPAGQRRSWLIAVAATRQHQRPAPSVGAGLDMAFPLGAINVDYGSAVDEGLLRPWMRPCARRGGF